MNFVTQVNFKLDERFHRELSSERKGSRMMSFEDAMTYICDSAKIMTGGLQACDRSRVIKAIKAGKCEKTYFDQFKTKVKARIDDIGVRENEINASEHQELEKLKGVKSYIEA